MSTITMNKTGYKTAAAGRKVSLMERFKNYLAENRATIIGGLTMMNGSGNAYEVYRMLNQQSGTAGWKNGIMKRKAEKK